MKQYEPLYSLLKANGLEMVRTSDHCEIRRGAQRVYKVSATPSDHRWQLNAVSHMKRLGILPPDAKLRP